MYCVHNGVISLQVWDTKKDRWVYIPARKWLNMSDKKRNRYTDWQEGSRIVNV